MHITFLIGECAELLDCSTVHARRLVDAQPDLVIERDGSGRRVIDGPAFLRFLAGRSSKKSPRVVPMRVV